PLHARRAARMQLDADHAADAAGGEKTRGASQTGTDVEDEEGGRDAGPPRQRVHRAQSAVVVLVEGIEVVGGERLVAARAPHGVEHLALADRMAGVEGEDAHGRRLKRPAFHDTNAACRYRPRGDTR